MQNTEIIKKYFILRIICAIDDIAFKQDTFVGQECKKIIEIKLLDFINSFKSFNENSIIDNKKLRNFENLTKETLKFIKFYFENKNLNDIEVFNSFKMVNTTIRNNNNFKI